MMPVQCKNLVPDSDFNCETVSYSDNSLVFQLENTERYALQEVKVVGDKCSALSGPSEIGAGEKVTFSANCPLTAEGKGQYDDFFMGGFTVSYVDNQNVAQEQKLSLKTEITN